MPLRALLLIALLLPGCAPSPSDGQVDQGQQQGLLEALQKLRLLNLAKGQHHNRRDTHEQAQQQRSQQVVMDIANASQSAVVFPDLDSLLRNRLKRDQSLMVQINVFNSAGKGCWHRMKASSPSDHATPVGSTVVSAVPSETPTPSSLQSASTPAPQLGTTSSTAYAGLITDYVPFIKPKAPSVGYPIGWVSSGEVIGVNATASIVVETTLASALETDSAPLQAQGEKDIVHTATPSEFASPSQYSEGNVTWDDSLLTAANGTSSNATDTAWQPASPVQFFPKQNFDDYRSKNDSKRPFAPFGLPPPVLKVTIPLLIPRDEAPDDTGQPSADVGMDFPKQPETYNLNEASRCLELLKLGLKCDYSTEVYRAKASGAPESPINILSGNIVAAVESRDVGRKNGGTVERCVCSDSDLGDSNEGFKLSGTQELLLKPRADALERLRPQQRPPLKVFGSLRYPPPTDIVYEYATTYVYEDYFPTALNDGQPQPQKAAPPPKLAQAPSYQQPQPVLQRSLGSLARPEAARYEPRAATNHPPGPFALEHKARRLKARNGARITSGPRKRFARDLRAVQEPVMWCPCSSTRKPPCTKTRKKCVKKKHPCPKKAKGKKPCRKKIQEPNMLNFPVTF
ncbi:hypothetical protein MTO96_009387 [Rhipicephalus appendiculatus]